MPINYIQVGFMTWMAMVFLVTGVWYIMIELMKTNRYAKRVVIALEKLADQKDPGPLPKFPI